MGKNEYAPLNDEELKAYIAKRIEEYQAASPEQQRGMEIADLGYPLPPVQKKGQENCQVVEKGKS
ncbi:hypothetical protein MUP56_00300 [Patescibacteria group bacterium]|nr:hypothetical protein [Patescibacteria group bacterium]